jgi:hypothetical protein
VDVERFCRGNVQNFARFFAGALIKRSSIHICRSGITQSSRLRAWLVGAAHDEAKPYLKQFCAIIFAS